MKRLTMISMAALMLLAVSCKKDKQKEIENAGSGFRATTENHAGESKTSLVGEAVNWNSGDAIMVTSGANVPKLFTTTSTEGTATFTAAEDLPINFYQGSYTAYYPASAFSGNTLTLGGTQNAVFNGQTYVPTFGNGANPMMASSGTTDLAFKNICGLLRLQLYSQAACTVKSITITTESDNLCGSGTVAWNNGEPTLDFSTKGNNSVTFDCGTGVVLSTTSDSPTLFNIVLPANSLASGFTVEVTNSNNETWTKQAPAGNGIVRSEVRQMPAIKVECKPNIPEGTLPGVFTIADGRQVRFSKGNLQYLAVGGDAGDASASAQDKNSVGGTWRFAENQYEICGNNNTQLSADCDVWIDLFGWGTSGWNHGATYYYPWSSAISSSNYYAYGTADYSLDDGVNIPDFGCNMADWGYNTIYSGETPTTGWRTLGGDEWLTLIGRTKDGNKLYGLATVNGQQGLIILPDDWNCPDGLSFTYGAYAYGTNNYSVEDWTKMQNAGAVFLPKAGARRQKTYPYAISGTDDGRYWTTGHGKNYFYFQPDSQKTVDVSDMLEHFGLPVRLVKDVPNGFNGGNANDFDPATW